MIDQKMFRPFSAALSVEQTVWLTMADSATRLLVSDGKPIDSDWKLAVAYADKMLMAFKERFDAQIKRDAEASRAAANKAFASDF